MRIRIKKETLKELSYLIWLLTSSTIVFTGAGVLTFIAGMDAATFVKVIAEVTVGITAAYWSTECILKWIALMKSSQEQRSKENKTESS